MKGQLAIFDTAYNIMLTVFILAIIWIIGSFMIGGRMLPMFTSEQFLPAVDSEGISREMYEGRLNNFWTGTQVFFTIIIAIPFVFLVFKFLFERETTSINVGGGY